MIFDWAVLFLTGAAYFVCRTPKSTAILFCAGILLADISIWYSPLAQLDHGWGYYVFSLALETFAAVGLLILSQNYMGRSRFFFIAMGLMFFASCCVKGPYIWLDDVSHPVYLRYMTMAREVAIAQTILAWTLSDGAWYVAERIRNFVSHRGHRRAHPGA